MERLIPRAILPAIFLPFANAMASDGLGAAALPSVEPPYRVEQPLSESARREGDKQALELLRLSLEYERHRAHARQDGFFAAEQALQSDLANAEKFQTQAAAESLALFYLAHGFGEEALSVLGEGDIANSALRHAFLRGVALFEIARYEDAAAAFSAGPLKRHPVVFAWRGLAREQLGAYGAAMSDLNEADLNTIPPGRAARFFLAKALCALEAGDMASAAAALRELRKTPLDDHARHKRAYVEALLQVKAGDKSAARRQFVRLRDYGAQPFASLAALELLRMRYSAGAMSVADAAGAAAAVERLLLTWKGGRFERQGLFQLGLWREAAGDIAGAFDARRLLLERHALSGSALAARVQMRSSLKDLIMANSIAPADAAAIFYENIDMAPPGHDGDVLIRQIADELVALDLLAPASELLDHQVFSRLRGQERSIAAARLAEIHLSNNRPARALRVIRSTRHARLPGEINHQRRLMEAKALWRLGEGEAALALLENDQNSNAILLRADIHWRDKNWKQAALAYAGAVQTFAGNEDAPENVRDAIYRAAAAFALAGDEEGFEAFKAKVLESAGDDAGLEILNALSASATDAEISQFLSTYLTGFPALEAAG